MDFCNKSVIVLVIFLNVISIYELRECECGITEIPTLYIYNEDIVEDLKTYPWLVTLHRKHPESDELPRGFCGGTLLSLKTVVTAASCLYEFFDVTEFMVGFSTKEQDHRVQTFRIKNFTLHPDFEMENPENDIAVIILYQEVPCMTFTRPICMTSEDFSDDGVIFQIPGWEQSSSNVLRNGKTEVISPYECDPEEYSEKSICVFGHQKYPCHGNAGNAVILKKGSDFYIAGIIPKGDFECFEDTPRFITNFSPHYSFIKKHLE